MIQVNFPKEGGQTAFTYSFQQCAGTQNVSFEFDDPSVDSWLDLVKSSTQLTISAATAPTSLINPRNAKVNIKVNDVKCDNYFAISQAGYACACSTAFTASSVSITNAGGTNIQVGSYFADSTCITAVTNTGSVSPSEATSWLPQTSVTVSNGEVKANVSSNTTTSSRNATITITAKLSDGSTCTQTIAVSQPGVGCQCDDIKFTPSVSFASEDKDATSKANIVAQAPSCVDCTSITYNSLQNFTVQKSGCDVYVYPSSENTTRTPIIETLTVSYTAGSSSCSSAITLTHLGTDCNCESIKSRIELYNYGDPTPVTIPTGVVTATTTVPCPLGERFVLAKANVQDCGTVHVSTTDIQFFDGGVNFDSTTSEVYCNGILSQGYSSGAYFINTKSAEKECSQITVTVTSGAAACTCADVSKLVLSSDLSNIPCDESSINLFEPSSVADCLKIKIKESTLPSWLYTYWDNVLYFKCPTKEARSATIDFEIIKDNTTTCVTSSVTISQLGDCPSCTCANMPLAVRAYDQDVELQIGGGTERVYFEPDGDIPALCDYEPNSCEPAAPRVTIIPRIDFYSPTYEWISNVVTGTANGDYYVEFSYVGTNENRIAFIYADFAIDGSKCGSSTDYYILTQTYANCPCEEAVSWFDGETEPVKEVSYSDTSVTWNLNVDYYCTSQNFKLDVTNYMTCSDFSITGSSTDTSVTATFGKNTSSQERQCNFATVRLIKNAGQSTSAVCETYTLGVKQSPCTCDDYDMNYRYRNGFQDCDGNYGYDDRAWWDNNKGTSRELASYDIPTADCISVSCDISSNDDPSLQYFDISTTCGYSDCTIYGEVKNGSGAPSRDSMDYTISIKVKNGSTDCYQSSDITFTLYKSCPCTSSKCNNYSLSSNLTTVTTSITTSDFTEVARLTNLPTDSCLKIEVEAQDTGNQAELRGNSIYVKGYRANDAFTLYVKLYYYDTNRGSWYMCSGGEETIALRVT